MNFLDNFFEALLERLNLPSWILVLFLSGYILWKLFSFYRDTVETNKYYASVAKELSGYKKLLNKIHYAVFEIQLKMSGEGIDNKLEAPGSPLMPTNAGLKLIKESGLEEILNQNKDFLINKLREIVPENYTKYDAQESARQVLVFLIDDPLMKAVKQYAYENGKNPITILKTGGLWLRDDFLGQERKISKMNN